MKRTSIADLDLSDPNNPKLVHLNRGVVKQNLQDFGKSVRVLVTYETYYTKRSVDQNSTLHWYMSIIAEETGMEMLDVKDQMAKKYLKTEIKDKDGGLVADPETGEVMTKVMSTADLTTIQFNEYTEKIRMWAGQFLGIDLPEPDPEKSKRNKNNTK